MMETYKLDLNELITIEEAIRGVIIAFFMEKEMLPDEVSHDVFTAESIYQLFDTCPNIKKAFSELFNKDGYDRDKLKFIIFLGDAGDNYDVAGIIPVFFGDFLDRKIALGFALNAARKSMLKWHKNRYCKENQCS